MYKPFEHQNKAVQWGYGRNTFPCFMEMRTGKSLVAIWWTKQWGDGQKILVAPLSTWYDWSKLFRNLHIKALFLSGTTKEKRKRLIYHCESAEWIVINPEGLTAWGREFFALTTGFQTCILDESVFIKNPRAKITKLLLKYRDYFKHRMVMTGTPIAETTEDIVSQMIWCNSHFMDCENFYVWRARYMYVAKFGWRLKRGVAVQLRDAIKRDAYVLSAKDAGMFTEQVKRVHLAYMKKDTAKDYETIKRDWQLGTCSTKYGVVKDIMLAQLASGIYPKDSTGRIGFDPFKVDAVRHLLQDGELQNQSVIIFSRWLKEIYALGTALRCPIMTGSVPISEREKLLRKFRAGEFPWMVVQSKVACRGLDLSCCDTAIIASNYWQYEIRSQIVARLRHPTKQIPTLIIDVIAKDTIEEKVYEVLHEKHNNARFFLQRLKAKVK